MTDLSKIKVPFALALLAAMFAVTPIIQQHGGKFFQVFSYNVTLNLIYLVFCAALGCSVYFYAIGLLGEKPIFEWSNKIGHIAYALALVTPPFFSLLYIASVIAVQISEIMKAPWFSKVLEFGSSALVAVLASIAANLIFNIFKDRDTKAKITQLEAQENYLLSRAKQLLNEGYYDLSVTESWKAIEIGLAKTLELVGIRRPASIISTFEIAIKNKLMTKQQIEELSTIRKIRNEAVHSERKVTLSEAQEALAVADKALASLERHEEDCYFCGKSF